MTGFGRSIIDNDQINANIEIKSINSRYKDLIIRLPNNLNILDSKIRALLNEKISRGKIECNITVTLNNPESNQIQINEPMARSLSKALDKLLKYNTLIEPSVDLSIFTSFPNLLTIREDIIDENEIWPLLEPGVKEALDELISSREKEGNNLENDITSHLNNAENILVKIKELAPISFDESQKKLRDRLELYLNGIDLDESRFLTEVAILVDKLALDEEISRLESHFKRFHEIVQEEEPVGRKLDFLIQELNRETNTIGSKTDNQNITSLVVELKGEIEKMREQVQNIE